MNLQPLEDRIVVRPAEAEETTDSGLVIPDTAKEKPQQGEVLAVGPGRRAENSGELIPIDLAVGDTVVYSKYGGTEITVDGEDLLILSSRDVLAKQTERQEEVVTPTGRDRGAAWPPSSRRLRFVGVAHASALGPLVVGLAVRAAHDLVDDHEPARPLEARQRLERGRELVGRSRARPVAATRTAVTASPNRSSGTPTTRQSATAGCSFTASSTSSGKIFSPPELMTTEPRPSSVIVPSASTLAKSPGTDQRVPSIDEERRRPTCFGSL